MTQQLTKFDTVSERARALQANGRLAEAAQAYQELTEQGGSCA